jgi:hypothetical protein
MARVIDQEKGGTGSEGPKKNVRFDQAIRNDKYVIKAKRIAPTVTRDGTPLEDEMDLFAHGEQTENEMRKDLMEARGGKKWHVRVLDPDNDNEVVASKTLLVGGEPKVDPVTETILQSPGGNGQGGSDQPPTEPTAEEIEQRIDNEIESSADVIEARKQARLDELELSKLKRQVEREKVLAEQKRLKREDAESQPKPASAADEIRKVIDEATRPLKEANDRLQKELDDRRRGDDNQKAIDAAVAPLKGMLDALTQKLSTPPPAPAGPTTNEILAKMESMQANLKTDMNQQFNSTLQNLTSKYDNQFQSLLTQLSALANRPQDGGALAQAAVGALTQIATKKEDGGGKHSDPIETTRSIIGLVRDTRELSGGGETQIVPRDFPSFLVEKVTNLAPDVMNFLEARRKEGGAAPTREELEKMFKEYGIKMWQELDGAIKREVRGGFDRLSQHRQVAVSAPAPAPVHAPTFAPPGAPGAMPQGGVPAPVPPQGPAAPPMTAPPAAPPPTVHFGGPMVQPAPVAAPPTAMATPTTAPQPPTLIPGDAEMADQIKKRVDWCLALLLREMKLGVKGMTWPEEAYDNLPKDILDRIITAANDTDIYEAVKPWADPTILEQIWAYLSSTNPSYQFYRDWVTDGLNWMKDTAAGVDQSDNQRPSA